MPLLYDGPAQQYVVVQAPTQLVNQATWLVALKFEPVQQSVINIRAFCFVFRNYSSTSLGDFFSRDEFRTSNDRCVHIFRYTSNPQDLISVVPLYDFTRLRVWTEGSGLAGP